MTWQPILDGDLADRARAAIDGIAADLRANPFPPADQVGLPPDRMAQYASLGLGRAGVALFYAYLARAEGRPEDGRIAARLLAEAVEAASAADVGISLCDGMAGVAWTAAHLRRAGLELPATDGADALGRRVDRVIVDHLERPSEGDDYDLLYGLVGFGVYALERLPEPAAAAILELVVERLEALAERRPDGITWWTPPSLTHQPERFPRGWYNLGVAHGVPAVIALLGLACAADVAGARARPLLERAVTWLLAQRLPDRAGSSFPNWVAPDLALRPARLAWCYGDAGVATILLLAARCVGEPAWARAALAVARAAAERPPDTAGVVDAAICHGAAGVGHLFNRLHQATGEPRLRDAARSWLERALAMRRPGQRIAGYSAIVPRDDGTPRRVAYRGLLSGAAGIGLALLAATTAIEPAWDRWLLASVPVRRSRDAG